MTRHGTTTPARRRLPPHERRQQIIAAAREVFIEYGVAGTRVKDVADHAGITEPLLYRYFHSKNELYNEAILSPLDTFIDTLAQSTHVLAQGGGVDRMAVLERFHCMFLEHVLPIAPLAGPLLFSDSADGVTFYAEVLLPRMRQLVEGVIQEISGWGPETIDLDIASKALLGVYFGLALEGLLDQSPQDPAYLAHQLMLLFGRGLIPEMSAKERKREPVSAPDRGIEVAFELPTGPTPRSPNRVPRAQRQLSVLAAARQVFVESGLTGARTRDIADRAGITEAFLFRLFPSREEMYREAVQLPLEKGFEELADRIAELPAAPIGDFIALTAEIGLSFFSTYGRLCALALFNDLSEGRVLYRDQLSPHLDRIRATFAERGLIATADIDPQVARRSIIGTLWAMRLDLGERANDSALPLADEARMVARLFTLGIKP